MLFTWPCWRLIESGKLTFTEATEKASIDDVFRLADVSSALLEAEIKFRKQYEKT